MILNNKISNLSTCQESFLVTAKEKRYSHLILIGILILTIVVFSGVRNADFIKNWDDDVYINQNHLIKNLSINNVKKIFSEPYFSNYHPFTTFVYALEYHFFNLNPVPYHLVNLVVHLINIILVFYFILFLTGRIVASVFISLLFAIHPMHVESVVWISELKDVLYAMFYLLALITYVSFIKKKKNWVFYGLALLFFALSLLSKSMAVTLPLVLLLIDYYLHKSLSFRFFIEKIPFFILSLVFGIVAYNAQKASGALDLIPSYNFIDRVYIVSYSVFYYIIKAIIPINLSAYHFFPIKSGSMLPFVYYISPIIPILIIAWIAVVKAIKKELIFGFLFFFLTVILVIQIIPIGESIVSERYTYIPYIGLFYVISLLPCILSRIDHYLIKKIRGYLLIIFFIYAAVLSVQSYFRVQKWENSLTLFNDVVNKYPDHYHSYFQRGNAKYDLSDFSGALRDINKSIELNPNISTAYMNRGIIRARQNNFDNALLDLNKAIELNPFNADAYINRGHTYYNYGLEKRNYQYIYQAIIDYSKTLELDQSNTNALIMRGDIKKRLGDINGACEDWTSAFNLGDRNAGKLLQDFCQ